jgi:hypothetical protein
MKNLFSKNNLKVLAIGGLIMFIYSIIQIYLSEMAQEVLIGVWAVIGFFSLFGYFYKKNRKSATVALLLFLPVALYAQSGNDPGEFNTGLLIASGLAGILIHILMKVKNHFDENKELGKITWIRVKSEIDWGRHILNSLIAVAIVIALALFKDQVADIYPVTYVSMIVAGSAADSIWKNMSRYNGRKLVKTNENVGN